MKAFAFVTLVAVATARDQPAFNIELSKHVNSLNVGWTAALEPHAHFANATLKFARKMMGTRLGGPTLPPMVHDISKLTIPDQFDSITNWPNCPTIAEIRDQSACGSCWAFGAAEAMSDRYCTFFGNTNPAAAQIRIAAGDLMSCCDSCGNGCDGGYPSAAWQYWVDNGLVNNTCEPYPFPECAHHTMSPKYPACPKDTYSTPPCPDQCKDGASVNRASHYFGSNAYGLRGEGQFQAELMKNGPFEVTMMVYQDFEQYKSGIYHHVSGPFLGGHAIRLVGWGVENGVKYWKIANSWNPSWGENGFFRIVTSAYQAGMGDWYNLAIETECGWGLPATWQRASELGFGRMADLTMPTMPVQPAGLVVQA